MTTTILIRAHRGARRSMRALGVPLLLSALWAHAAQAAPRIAPLPEDRWSDAQRAIVAEFAAEGRVPNLLATFLHHPVMAETVLPFTRYLSSESSLPPRHRELIGLRTAWLTRSDYLWAHRAGPARRAGLTDAELRDVAHGPEAPAWDPFEAALLRAADETHVDSFIGDAVWRTLAARYDERQLLDLAFTVAGYTMLADAANALGVEIEAELPDRRPSGIPHAPAAEWTRERLIDGAPRIPPLERGEWTAEIRERLDPEGSGRRIANVYTTFVRNLPAERLRARVTRHIRNGTTLSERYRELLLLRIGLLCRSEYEWAAHVRIGRRIGLDDADIERILAAALRRGGGPPVETALLRAADELYRDDTVSDETWDTLAGELDTKQLLDMLIAVGGYKMVSTALNSVGVQLDPDMADFRFPPRLR